MRHAAAARRRIEGLCAAPGPERPLREALLAELGAVVPFDFHAWVLTDPLTWVGTAPLATVPVPELLPTLIRLKYLTPTHRWTTLRRCVALAEGESPWRELLVGWGVRDVASTVFADRQGCWAFLDLWRTTGPFTAAELRFLDDVGPVVTRALRAAVLATFTLPGPAPAGPAVLLLDADLAPRSGTPGSEAHLRLLLPTAPGRSPVPAAALNAAAQLLAVEAGVDDRPPLARLHLVDGVWVAVRAARLGGDGDIAVTIERAAPAERAAVFGRAAGLTARERELVDHLAGGSDTRGVARAMRITEDTVHDHLKAVFAKTGVRARAELLARARG